MTFRQPLRNRGTGQAESGDGHVSAEKLSALVETGISLSSELSLESLLRKIVGTAVDLTGAQYGAMGVIDRTGKELDQFLTVGIDKELAATIGDLPRGRGVLGVLIRDREPLRLADLSTDSRAVGFPPGHPPMRSFLGVPITLRGTAFGNLYLTEKAAGAEFSVEDQEIVRLLAAQAAAIENARLYESRDGWSRQLELLNELSATFASETEPARLFPLAAARLRELLQAKVVMVQLPTTDGASLVVEAANGESAEQLVGLRLNRMGSKSGRTLERGVGERIDSLLDDPDVDLRTTRLVEATSALYVPLIVRDRAVGVLVAFDKEGRDHRFTDADMRTAHAFANRVALALDLSERVGRETVRALVDGQEQERTRLSRELHDETGQALASILLGLKEFEGQVGEQPLSRLRDLVATALANVRQLTTELRPPALDDFGLQAALEHLTDQVANRSGLTIHLQVSLADRALVPAQETTIYRIVQEALTNAIKHAQAGSVSVVVSAVAHSIRAVVEDDGVGFTPDDVREGALGLVGMRERAILLGGRLEIDSAPGAGTRLLVEIPL